MGYYQFYDIYVEPYAVDSVLINGAYRKRISFDAGYWIEGIGNTQGLFLEPWPNVSEYLVDLYCMSANDTTLYPEFSVGECEYPVGINEKRKDNLQLTIYPNPCKDEFFIDLEKSISHLNLQNIILINSFGKKINPICQIENNRIRIEMKSYQDGIYIIGFPVNDKILFQKFIKE